MTLASDNRGFTLIELMIVMVIMMSVVALVGGLGVDLVAKYKIKAEEKALYSLTRQISQSAFLKEHLLIVTFAGKEVRVSSVSSQSNAASHTFSFLEFAEQEIRFNTQGLPNQLTLQYLAGGTPKLLNLELLLEGI